tara:strand:+ start:1068 stop:1244 length:177 start_codon:yes stop_codon:yes gene_type:complete
MLTLFKAIWAVIVFIFMIVFGIIGFLFEGAQSAVGTSGDIMLADHLIKQVRGHYKEDS